MEVPKWIKVKELIGFVEDPVNFVAELQPEEIVEVLKGDGWMAASYEYNAYLDDKSPAYTLAKPLPSIGGIVRLHVRMWTDGLTVGNAHLDAPSLGSFARLSPHESAHDVGKAYLAYLFIKRGYGVELVYLGNTTETNDGFAVKIYKKSEREKP